MAKERKFSTHNDLKPEVREQAVTLLNQHLADTMDLYSQTKQAHWNVKGREFYQLHLLFDELAENVEKHIDVIAERAVALGGSARGTVRMASAASRITEYPESVDGRQHLEALTARYAEVAKTTRAAIAKAEDLDDKDTAELFTQVSRDLDKSLWFLEAHLQD